MSEKRFNIASYLRSKTYFINEIDSFLNEKISKSSTVGLIKNDGTIDTTTYLSQHQDISGKENSSNKKSSWSNPTTNDNYPSEKLVKDSLDAKANANHNHNIFNLTQTTVDDINFLSEGTDINGSGFDIATKLYYNMSNDKLYYNKDGNADNNNSNELATLSDIPSVPNPSNTTPSPDSLNGSVGIGNTTYARANHSHPQSTIYAEANHNHNIFNLTQTITDGVDFLTSGTDANGGGFDIAAKLYYNLNNDKFYYDKSGSTDNDNGNELATLNDIPSVPNPSTSIPAIETQNGAAGTSTTYAKGDHSHPRNSWISYGQITSNSTTVFTATVPNLTELVDGTTVMLRNNNNQTSAEGWTLNVNGLGAKPVYSSMANATRDTTIFNKAYTMLFVYDSTRVTGGCWVCYRGFNSNDNAIGYQIRTNNTAFTATDKGYRYRLWLETDDGKYMPVNTSTSTNNTANRSSAMNTRKFWLKGKILYCSTNDAIEANAAFSTSAMWQQYNISLGYSFNNTGSALALVSGSPLYMVATNEGGGKGKLASPYYTQTLPSTDDGKLYIYLGHMSSAANMELALHHPIYEYKNGSIRKYRDTYTTSEIDSVIGNIVDILMGTGGT